MSRPDDGHQTPRYTYLGPEGTFTEAALRQVPGAEDAECVPAGSVITALAAVRAGTADYAMVPIENSVEGGVSATLDDIAEGEPLQIRREVLVPISFVLVGRREMELSEVRSVATHTHGWAQVRNWAVEHIPQAEFIPASSTLSRIIAIRV